MTTTQNVVLLWIGIVSVRAGCVTDPGCSMHRICEFGSTKAYEAVFLRILNLSGCPEACADDQCGTCTCNTSGPVWESLTSDPVSYCQHNPICRDPMVKKAINFPATTFACDNVFSIAIKSIYQLCGTTYGGCRNGACVSATCITPANNACLAQNGVDSSTSFLIGGLAVLVVILFLWGYSALAIVEDEVALDEDEEDTAVPRRTSSSSVSKVRRTGYSILDSI